MPNIRSSVMIPPSGLLRADVLLPRQVHVSFADALIVNRLLLMQGGKKGPRNSF